MDRAKLHCRRTSLTVLISALFKRMGGIFPPYPLSTVQRRNDRKHYWHPFPCCSHSLSFNWYLYSVLVTVCLYLHSMLRSCANCFQFQHPQSQSKYRPPKSRSFVLQPSSSYRHPSKSSFTVLVLRSLEHPLFPLPPTASLRFAAAPHCALADIPEWRSI